MQPGGDQCGGSCGPHQAPLERWLKPRYWGPPALAQGVYATGSGVWLEIFTLASSQLLLGVWGPTLRSTGLEKGVQDGVVGDDGAEACCMMAELFLSSAGNEGLTQSLCREGQEISS